ncbi:MAG TPA: sulfite exporter TauE/SafE family protein [Sphingomicrobium sp.]|nr:sulfite exporter TauE/SafE family protein [Sphingomicrobium sp.]
MTLSLVQYLLGIGSGALVGFVLGLVGGGGSILAVPLMVYLVGVRSPHLAIGTSALAVAANAATGLVHHARAGHVKWRCAALFAVCGIAGAAVGSTLGKAFDGQKLLFLFALLMIGVGVVMLLRKGHGGNADVKLDAANVANLSVLGLSAGVFSGFFGIGGGFLIVPGLIAATGMPMINAVGSSLVAVTAFGLTTAVNYAVSGLVDWLLAFTFIAGGIAGSLAGTHLARHLSKERGRLTVVFSVLIFAVAAYMLWKSAAAAWG